MSYSNNPDLVDQRMGEMLELRAGRACQWHTVADPQVTRRLANRIRETLYIAKLYPDRFPELARAKDAFEIHEVEPGLVEAKPKAPQPFAAAAVATSKGYPAGREVSTVGKSTAQECIDAWQAHLPSNDAMNFQQARLPVEELTKLWEWCSDNTNHPRLMLLVGQGHLTISLVDPDVEKLAAWRPPQAAPKPERAYDI